MSPDTVSIIVRCVSFILLFQAVGASLFVVRFKPLANTQIALHRLIVTTAFSAMMVIGIHGLLEAARMTGEFSGALDQSLQRMAWTSASGLSHELQIVGLLVIVIAEEKAHQLRVTLTCIGSAMSLASFLLIGHTSVSSWRAALAPLLLIHLFIVAFWFGSLLPLWIVVRREAIATAANVLVQFSKLAGKSVPLIAIAGLVMTLLIAKGVPPLNKPYGALILTKLGGFIVLMGFAAWNRWRLVPALEGNRSHTISALQRSILMEFALIICILSVTAVMTTFFSPN